MGRGGDSYFFWYIVAIAIGLVVQYFLIKAAVKSALREFSSSANPTQPTKSQIREAAIPPLAEDEAYFSIHDNLRFGTCSACGSQQTIGNDTCSQCGRKFINWQR